MLGTYVKEQERTAEHRKRTSGFLGMWKTELGGSVSQVHHLYHWKSYTERDAQRPPAKTSFRLENLASMTLPMPSLRDCLHDSRSMIMNEATACLADAGLPGALAYDPSSKATDLADDDPSPVAYEMRTYQLQLGYSTVPRFLELYGEGLKDKLAADDSGASDLCTLLYSDCGSLNVVIEIWRHESLERSMASRQASRKAPKWRAAVNEIAGLAHTFETAMVRPFPSSPWR